MTTWVGIDVPEGTHWVRALDEGGRVRLSRAVSNTREGVDALSAELRAPPAPVRVGLDVDGSIAAFLLAVLPADGLALVHVPGLAVDRAAHCRTRGQGAPVRLDRGGRSGGPVSKPPRPRARLREAMVGLHRWKERP
jgi:hypothetical protein